MTNNTNVNKEKLNSLLQQPYMRSISDEKLRELYKILKPIVTVDEIKYLLKEFTLEQLRNQLYDWSAEENRSETINKNSLEIVSEFLCLHKNRHCNLNEPTLAEILSQIPDDTVNQANAFEVVEYPEERQHLLKISESLCLSKIRIYRIKK